MARKKNPAAPTPAIVEHAVLGATHAHPGQMSPVLLEYLLHGEVIGRMAEKGLLDSPWHGAVPKNELGYVVVAEAIANALERGHVTRQTGFYPALHLTDIGRRRMADLAPVVADHMYTVQP